MVAIRLFDACSDTLGDSSGCTLLTGDQVQRSGVDETQARRVVGEPSAPTIIEASSRAPFERIDGDVFHKRGIDKTILDVLLEVKRLLNMDRNISRCSKCG